MHLTIITTGGTIDGADSDKGTSRTVSDAVKWLREQPAVELTHVRLLNKDSRQITGADRRLIVEAVEAATTPFVLVTHGTYTICETGQALKASYIYPEKFVLLTGAWVPFGEAGSDAPGQMEFALRCFSTMPQGVFIAMDGRLWNPDLTRKQQMEPGDYRLIEVNNAA